MSTLSVSIVITLVIIIFVVIIFAAAITKGYSYKHTVDQLEDNPYVKKEEDKTKSDTDRT